MQMTSAHVQTAIGFKAELWKSISCCMRRPQNMLTCSMHAWQLSNIGRPLRLQIDTCDMSNHTVRHCPHAHPEPKRYTPHTGWLQTDHRSNLQYIVRKALPAWRWPPFTKHCLAWLHMWVKNCSRLCTIIVGQRVQHISTWGIWADKWLSDTLWQHSASEARQSASTCATHSCILSTPGVCGTYDSIASKLVQPAADHSSLPTSEWFRSNRLLEWYDVNHNWSRLIANVWSPMCSTVPSSL